MSKTNRAVVVYGNDTHLNIQMHKFDKTSGEYIDFDLTQVTDLNVFLICSKHATEIHLDYTINSQFTNIITCDIDYRLLHPNASYGIVVEGYDGQDHFRYEALPSEGFLVISNTSGLKITDEVNTIDLSARTGWGISVDGADLTNYYTKDEVDALLENIDLEDYYDKTETDDLLDDKQDTLVSGTNIKTINNQSILGAGNITIESEKQIQSDWNQTDTTKADYIKNKPNLSTYAQKSDLNNYYDKTETDTMLNQKANTTDLNNYQETLVSGTNIKTINNESILGSGNITIQGGGGEQVQANWEETDTTDPSYIQNKPDLTQYATQTDLALKQDTLVSGTNIKTVNNESLLGSGNITIQSGDSYTAGDNIDIINNVISLDDDIELNSVEAFSFDIIDTINYRYWYELFPDEDDICRYLAERAMIGEEEQVGEYWYDLGASYVLNIETASHGSFTIPGTEWTLASTIPSWVLDLGYPVYESTTLVNGEPVYGAYNQDSNSPDFFVNNADTYDITSMYATHGSKTSINNTLSTLSNSVHNLDERINSISNNVNNTINSLSAEADEEFKSTALVITTLNTAKQDTLVSGTNIKTINNESILGAGNITQVQADWSETGTSSPAYIQNKPTIPSTTGMVTGYIAGVSTNNLKIDVVATLPASPDSNTIYIVQ